MKKIWTDHFGLGGEKQSQIDLCPAPFHLKPRGWNDMFFDHGFLPCHGENRRQQCGQRIGVIHGGKLAGRNAGPLAPVHGLKTMLQSHLFTVASVRSTIG
jgi:hypothetical protein